MANQSKAESKSNIHEMQTSKSESSNRDRDRDRSSTSSSTSNLNETGGGLRETLSNVVGEDTAGRLEEAYSEGRNRIGNVIGQVRDYVKHPSVPSMDDVTSTVKRYPMAALAIGFGLGIFAGWMIPRRSSL